MHSQFRKRFGFYFSVIRYERVNLLITLREQRKGENKSNDKPIGEEYCILCIIIKNHAPENFLLMWENMFMLKTKVKKKCL